MCFVQKIRCSEVLLSFFTIGRKNKVHIVGINEPKNYYFSIFAEFKRDGESDYSAGTEYLFSNIGKGIFVASPNCKNKYLIPIYICPCCGVKHTKLLPGKYGAFKRICICGQKIPSHFMTGRGSKLAAECPKCGIELRKTDSKPLCVPVVGGGSSGKTAYITAFSYDFIEKSGT